MKLLLLALLVSLSSFSYAQREFVRSMHEYTNNKSLKPTKFSHFVFFKDSPPYYEVVSKKGFLIVRSERSSMCPCPNYETLHIPADGTPSEFSYTSPLVNTARVRVDGSSFEARDKIEGILFLGTNVQKNVDGSKYINFGSVEDPLLIIKDGNRYVPIRTDNFPKSWSGVATGPGSNSRGMKLATNTAFAGLEVLDIVELFGQQQDKSSIEVAQHSLLAVAMDDKALSAVLESLKQYFSIVSPSQKTTFNNEKIIKLDDEQSAVLEKFKKQYSSILN